MRWFLSAWAILTPLSSSWAAPDLAIERSLWGFTGRPILEAFNPLTLEIKNPSSEPYAGPIQLARSVGGRPAGIPETQSIAIAPGGKRIVQFTPYIDHLLTTYQWRVTWTHGHEDLESPTQEAADPASPAVVELMSSRTLTHPPTGHFPLVSEPYFPTNVCATGGLHSVILDHAPEWEAARAAAFWLWIQRGGIVHLFPQPGEEGQAPRFQGILSPLNDPTRSTFGHGRLVRHAKPTGQIPAHEWEGLKASKPQPLEAPSDIGRQNVFRAFGLSTQPDIPWKQIYIAALAYLILIGPGHYLFARNSRRDYRMVLLSLILIVGTFSWLFARIGQRGYGESDKWMSAAIARPLGKEGRYDVIQWSHAFLTQGDSYQFRYDSPHQLFDIAHELEAVPGWVQGGLNGFLEVDIPLYTSRNLLSQAMLEGPAIEATLQSRSVTTGSDVEIIVAGDLDVRQAWYRQDNTYFILQNLGQNRWATTSQDRSWKQVRHVFGQAHRNSGDLDRDLPRWLLNWWHHAHEQTGKAIDAAELLLLAEAPASFQPKTPLFEERFARVLYVIPLANTLTADSGESVPSP